MAEPQWFAPTVGSKAHELFFVREAEQEQTAGSTEAGRSCFFLDGNDCLTAVPI